MKVNWIVMGRVGDKDTTDTVVTFCDNRVADNNGCPVNLWYMLKPGNTIPLVGHDVLLLDALTIAANRHTHENYNITNVYRIQPDGYLKEVDISHYLCDPEVRVQDAQYYSINEQNSN